MSDQSDSTTELRLRCNVCDHRIDASDDSLFAEFSCPVRAFRNETFRLWRCSECRTIHCLDKVDLDQYYASYPFASATLTWPFRFFFPNLARRLTRHGFARHHAMLDYGCGRGLFLQHLRGRGFVNCHGYDPYASQDEFGNRAALGKGPFDYILLQDVLEHVEKPSELLAEMDRLLAPAGHILVGTPNAENLDLSRPEVYGNEVHAPYHLHIYTRSAVEDLGRSLDWTPVGFFDRPYHDIFVFGLNTRATKTYQRLMDGTVDALLEPIKLRKALTSPSFLFYASVGYWLSHRSDMAVMFRKHP